MNKYRSISRAGFWVIILLFTGTKLFSQVETHPGGLMMVPLNPKDSAKTGNVKQDTIYKKDTVVIYKQEPPPSEELVKVKGLGFMMKIPENFHVEKQNEVLNALFAQKYIGKRRGDCFLMVVVKDAKNNKGLAKIAENTRQNISGASKPKETTIDKEKAIVFDYGQKTSEGNVKTRFYFTIYNDKLFIIALTWNTDKEEKDFLPALEKSVHSFRFNREGKN